MRVLSAQVVMSSTVEENLIALQRALEAARSKRADLVLCPELSLTGYHQGVPALCRSDSTLQTLEEAQRSCREQAVSAVVGVPWHAAICNAATCNAVVSPTVEGGVLNAMVAIDASGDIVHVQSKKDVTPSEARLFSRGDDIALWALGDIRLAVVACHEVLDVARVSREARGADLVLWPSYVQWRSGPDDYEEAAKRLAGTLRCWVVQANWATSVNDATLRDLGGSLVVDPSGAIVFSAPPDAESLDVHEIGLP